MPAQVDRILAEYDLVRGPAADGELEALKTALFLEDAFGIELSDAEIAPEVLGNADAVRALVLERLEGR